MLPFQRAMFIADSSGTPFPSIVPSIRQNRADASERINGPATGFAVKSPRRRTVAVTQPRSGPKKTCLSLAAAFEPLLRTAAGAGK